MNIQDSIIFFMEILGTIAFAASGAMVGIRKRMDIFGICVPVSYTHLTLPTIA